MAVYQNALQLTNTVPYRYELRLAEKLRRGPLWCYGVDLPTWPHSLASWPGLPGGIFLGHHGASHLLHHLWKCHGNVCIFCNDTPGKNSSSSNFISDSSEMLVVKVVLFSLIVFLRPGPFKYSFIFYTHTHIVAHAHACQLCIRHYSRC